MFECNMAANKNFVWINVMLIIFKPFPLIRINDITKSTKDLGFNNEPVPTVYGICPSSSS